MVEESEFISFFVREQKYKIKWLEILEKKVGDILYFSEIKKNIAKQKIIYRVQSIISIVTVTADGVYCSKQKIMFKNDEFDGVIETDSFFLQKKKIKTKEIELPKKELTKGREKF